ncbi:hypothetical protein FB45DRAFT_1042604 [Roridomyces roridus]|uniref:Uncharacterized protein n=1 Tax=Roridomyces roridus TaxID=1738132 RepID=A0AAD7AZE7_9AGAR|nr:hypothetical protein FB45DRAFT_1042604 [Roridomyces roridus]
MWHPNILQVFAVSSFPGTYAVVAHDDLAPYDEFLECRRPSAIVTVFFYACWKMDRELADEYSLGLDPEYDPDLATHWVRRSTGRLCLDLGSSHIHEPALYSFRLQISAHLANKNLNDPDLEPKALQYLSIDQFHDICWLELLEPTYLGIPVDWEVSLGAVMCVPSDGLQNAVEIAALSGNDLASSRWMCAHVRGETMGTGWTRFNCADIQGRKISLSVYYDGGSTRYSWLSQANYIFKCTGVTSSFHNYGFVEEIFFEVDVSSLLPEDGIPTGYLFLCPFGHFMTGTDSNTFRWPPRPWFWSRDAAGRSPLSSEEAATQGFPSITLSTELEGYACDASVYAGLREFHAAKGFDPESQELAIQFDYPLFELSRASRVDRNHASCVGDSHFAEVPEVRDSGGLDLHTLETPAVSVSFEFATIIELVKLGLMLFALMSSLVS